MLEGGRGCVQSLSTQRSPSSLGLMAVPRWGILTTPRWHPHRAIPSTPRLGCQVPSGFQTSSSFHCPGSSDGSLGGSCARKCSLEDRIPSHPAGPRPAQDVGLAVVLRCLPSLRKLKPVPRALQLLPGAPGLESAPKSGPSQSWCSLEFSICGLKTQFLGGGPQGSQDGRGTHPRPAQSPKSRHQLQVTGPPDPLPSTALSSGTVEIYFLLHFCRFTKI